MKAEPHRTSWWTAKYGATIAAKYDIMAVITACRDDSSTWQEFGEMMWHHKTDVPDAFRPPNNAHLTIGIS